MQGCFGLPAECAITFWPSLWRSEEGSGFLDIATGRRAMIGSEEDCEVLTLVQGSGAYVY